MDDIGFWCVERHRMVPNVLRGVERPVRQGAVELQERDQTGRRHVLEARQWPEHLVDLHQLGDPVFGKSESLLALGVGAAGQAPVQSVQFLIDDPPDLMLGLRVGRNRRGRSGLPIHSQGG